MAKQYGDPLIAIRMPGNMIAGLKLLATKKGITTSEIVRSLVDQELKDNGISTAAEPNDGQMRLE